MVCGHVCVFLRMIPFCLCENQSSLVLTYNAPWHVKTVEVWFQLECASEQLVSMVTANWHFYVTTFFLWYPNLIIFYEHVVFSDELDFCLWEMLRQGGS